METIFQDFRFGARVLLRAPLVAVSIIVVLGLGIGANSTMFGILDGLFLHSVHYPDPQTLVFVWSVDSQGALSNASAADYLDFRRKTKTLSDVAAWSPTSLVFLAGERPRQLGGARVTANFFRTLRVKPILGRTFLPDEDGIENPAHAARSVVISYRLWQEDLGADPNILGRTVLIEALPYTIIGVMPPNFQFWWRPHDLWIPVSLDPNQRDYRNLALIARTRAPRAAVKAEMNVLARSLADAYPKSDKGWTVLVEGLEERLLNRTFRLRLLLASAAVGLVLLIACANVTGLLLARSAARNQEFAVRVSLGATGWRLGRQLLAESALLALAGGAAGLAITWTLIRAIPALVPSAVIPTGSIELNGVVISFCLAASAVTCLLVGLAPALAVGRSGTQTALRSARTTGPGRSPLRFRQALVAGEIAIALILLASAWLMMGSLRALTGADPGFDAANVLTLRVVIPAAKYDGPQAARFFANARERIAALAGVEAATMATTLPHMVNGMMVRFDRQDSPRDEAQQPSAAYAGVGLDYFTTLKIPLKRGRLFTESDNERAKPVAIVSEDFAQRYFPGQDPVGSMILIYRPTRTNGEERVIVEIVGVAGNINLGALSADTRSMIYVPFAQNPYSRTVLFAVRARGNSANLASSVRATFASLDPEQPVDRVTPLEQLLGILFAEPRFETRLMGCFALLSLLLAAIGIYGVNAYSVAQRRAEIGLRMALGASRGAVLREVIGRGLLPTLIGIGLGLAGSISMMFWLKSVLVGAMSPDPLAFIGAALLLSVVALIACYVPARSATQIDPAIALRAE
ncbi:MAG TPA: ABC transporter permease [Bryobacteraceae bacterium]|jgi:putative ABC transport system permease protein|nr:ABC transporter permease [Bryobacteraceae bacterium]